MTQNECEKLIAEKLVEIVGIYHQYNPGGTYLCMFYNGDEEQQVSFNNRYWNIPNDPDGPGEDADRPLNHTMYIREG